MKKLKRTATPLLLLLLSARPAWAIDITIPNIQAAEGNRITLNLTTSDVTGAKIFSCDFTLIYDSSLLTAVSAQTSGTLMANWGAPTLNIGAGQIRFSAGSTQSLAGSGTLVKIVMDVAANAPVGKSSDLAFASFVFNEGQPTVALKKGLFTVVQDREPPNIVSGPVAQNLTSRSVTIQWRTDEAAHSRVEYGETAAYGAVMENAALVTQHSVLLTGLQAGSEYHFRVGSSDKAGNGPTFSTDQIITAPKIQIQLPDLALDPGAVLTIPITVSDLSDQNVQKIEFTLRYDAALLSASGLATEGTICAQWPSPVLSTSPGEMRVQLSGSAALNGSGTLAKLVLKVAATARIGQRTDLEIVSLFLNQGAVKAEARKGSFTIKDTQAPHITIGPTISQATANSAIVYWETNEPATSQVRFGPTLSYGRSASLASLSTRHEVELTHLSPATVYHFRVSSLDSSGNGPVESADYSLTTLAAAGIAVKIGDGEGSAGQQVVLPVQCANLSQKGVLAFAAIMGYDQSVLSLEKVIPNSAMLAGWSAFSYQVLDGQILVKDEGLIPLSGSGELFRIIFTITPAGRDGDSEVRFEYFHFNEGSPEAAPGNGSVRITGNPDLLAPRITRGPFVDQVGVDAARITWYTDEPADAKVDYGPTMAYGQSVADDRFVVFHQLILGALNPAAEYHFRAKSMDGQGNVSPGSSDASFRTLNRNGIAISVANVTQAPGTSFEVPIQAGNLSGQEVYSMYLIFKYDDTVLNALSVISTGTIVSSWGEPVFTLSPGRIVVAMGGIKPLSGSGSLIKFRMSVSASAEAGAKIPLILERVKFNEGNPEVTWSNGSVSLQDVDAPQLSSPPVIFSPTANSAQIVWNTNEPTTTLAEYGQSLPYSRFFNNDQLQSAHTLPLSGLQENTLYHVRVGGLDASGNGPVWSTDITFQTATRQGIVLTLPDTVSGIGSEFFLPVYLKNDRFLAVDRLLLVIAFKPDVLSLTGIRRENTLTALWPEESVTRQDSSLVIMLSGPALTGQGLLFWVTGHTQALAKPGRMSDLMLTQAVCNQGIIPVATERGRLTVFDLSPPAFTLGPIVESIASTAVTLRWQTDKSARAEIHYGTTPAYGLVVQQPNVRRSNSQILAGLQPQTLYYFKVALYDSLGKGPVWSPEATFQTMGYYLDIGIPDTTARRGETIALPVVISQVTGMGIQALSMDVLFDSQVFSPGGLSTTGSLAEGWNQNYALAAQGRLRINLQGQSVLLGAGTVFHVQLQVSAGAEVDWIRTIALENVSINGGALIPTSMRAGSITILAAEPTASVHLSFPDTSLAVDRAFSLPLRYLGLKDRVFSSFTVSIHWDPNVVQLSGVGTENTLLQGQEPDLVLTENALQVTASLARLPERGILFYLQGRTRSRLPAGTLTEIQVQSAAFQPDTPPLDLQNGHIVLIKRSDVIWGVVLHEVARTGIDSVLVRLLSAAGIEQARAFGERDGTFNLTDLDSAQSYKLSATRRGYVQINFMDLIRPGMENVQVLMSPLHGLIQGVIRDENGLAAAQALVTVDNGKGGFASANTDSLGAFRITDLLKSGSYKMHISKYGYVDQERIVLADGTALLISLQPHYGKIRGRVRLSDSTAVHGAIATLVGANNSVTIPPLASDTAGEFVFDSVKAGEYLLSIARTGYLSDPKQIFVQLAPGQIIATDFILIPAVLHRLSLEGPEHVANDAAARFDYAALTESGQQLTLSKFEWQVEPALAGMIKNGILQPNSQYIGPALVRFKVPDDNKEASLAISIYAAVNSRTQKAFTCESGAVITLFPGSFEDSQQLKYESYDLPPLKANSKNASAVSRGFMFLPDAYRFAIAARLYIPSGDMAEGELTLGRWDKESAQWEILPNVVQEANGLAAEIERLGLFAVLKVSQPLAIQSCVLQPNPFSPDVDTDLDGYAGLTILLHISSRDSRMPLVSVKIYTMNGELLRTCMDKQPLAKELEQRIHWDGYTDHRLLARNGRYLVRITVEEAQKMVEKIVSVVLIR